MTWGLALAVAGFVIAVLVAARITRGGGGAAVDILTKSNEVLTKRLDEQGKELEAAKAQIRVLEQRTDFSAVMGVHEQRAAERHTKTLAVLDLIAERLGPDPNGT